MSSGGAGPATSTGDQSVEVPRATRATSRGAFETVVVPTHYRGFAITPRTFQINGSGHWPVDVLIGSRVRMRAFSSPETFPTQSAALAACREFGHRIIDGGEKGCSIRDL